MPFMTELPVKRLLQVSCFTLTNHSCSALQKLQTAQSYSFVTSQFICLSICKKTQIAFQIKLKLTTVKSITVFQISEGSRVKNQARSAT